MRDFVYGLISFVYDTFYEIFYNINSYINNKVSWSNTIGLSNNSFNNFLDKNIISGDLITIGLTWRELILYFFTIFLLIFFIILVFKLVSGVVRFFFIGR